ncbi:DUF4429 domain-containing protein [Streptomyces sp. GSL17-111]|uniref:DUF4429 domain-containing protein n=1 Tax=Streptomyces sp. GSL17-111 TaxID=3121596 RepID=UPI0030F41D4D
MAEITQKDGTWSFDGATLRIVPGHSKGVHILRRTIGELTVPLHALAGVAHEPGRRSGRLRLRLRGGADPLLQVTRGKLPDAADPYQLTVEPEQTSVAEYLVDEVRTALTLEEVPDTPCDRFLLPGPPVPLTATGGDATVSFDGDLIRLVWNWKTEEGKKAGGPRTIHLEDLRGVEWQPSVGWENGHLRFLASRSGTEAPPKYDPHAVVLHGSRKDPLTALVAAAVTARLHPAAPPLPSAPLPSAPPPDADPKPPTAGGPAPGGEDHDALLRRLRELGELHTSGVLTTEEFTAAKQAVLRRF